MPEAGFPDTYHTESQTTSANVVRLDLGVLRTVFGYTKIAEIVLDLLGFICVISSVFAYHSRGSWFNFVAMGGFWYSGVILTLYIFHVPEKLSIIPWKKVEFVFGCIWAFFYLIASSLAANYGWVEALAAAAFFGFSAMVVYAYDAWLCFGFIRGEVVVKTTTTTTIHTPTTY